MATHIINLTDKAYLGRFNKAATEKALEELKGKDIVQFDSAEDLSEYSGPKLAACFTVVTGLALGKVRDKSVTVASIMDGIKDLNKKQAAVTTKPEKKARKESTGARRGEPTPAELEEAKKFIKKNPDLAYSKMIKAGREAGCRAVVLIAAKKAMGHRMQQRSVEQEQRASA